MSHKYFRDRSVRLRVEDLERRVLLTVNAALFEADSFLTASNGHGVAAGDLDGDGDLDAFVANIGQNNAVLINDGSGNFAEQLVGGALDNASSLEVALGDLDGDGDLDAYVANRFDPDRVWLNDGSGNFTAGGGGADNENEGATHVVLGDVDGDGDLDAVIAATTAGPAVMLNPGDGGVFTHSNDAVMFPIGTRGVDIGDLNGDGQLDLIFAHDDHHSVYFNYGGGVFDPDNYQQLPLGSKNVTLGDLDGDGDLDAFSAVQTGPNRVWLNDGLGTFSESDQPQIAAVDDSSFEIDLGDLDGDGDLDALATNISGPNTVWQNDGHGNFTPYGTELGFESDTATVLGDWDGDGDLDAISVNGDNFDPHVVWRNDILTIQGTSGNDVIDVFLGPFVNVIVNGTQSIYDINNVPFISVNGLEGFDQITVIGNSLDEVASADGDTGAFSFSSEIYQLVGTGFEDVTLDGDTGADYIDLYGSSDAAKKDKLRGTVGETTLHAGYTGTNPNTADFIFRAFAFDRVDSFGRGGVDYGQVFGTDGDDHFYRFADYEVMVAGDSTQKTKGFSRIDAFGRHGTDVAYFDDTTGDDHFYTFPEFVVMVLGNEQDRVMAKGFLDVSAVSSQGGNDTANLREKSNLDRLFASEDFALLLRTVEEQRESVLGFANVIGITNSGVTFSLPEDIQLPLPTVDAPLFNETTQPLASSWLQGVALGDFRPTGVIVEAFIAADVNTVLVREGTGFTEQVANPDWNGLSTEAALGDLDGDGDLDAFVTGLENSVWLNDGSGNFTTGQVLDWDSLVHVVLADLDNDGDLDAATADIDGAAFVWENQGDGTFVQTSGFTGGGGLCRGIDAGNLDGNGELDIFLACEFGHVVGLADGNGGYNTTTLPFGAKNVALGDLDGDGDLDAFDANLIGPNRVWINDGQGGFTQSSQPILEAQATPTWQVDLGDLDSDGDLDAVTDNTVWRNDGNGNFSVFEDYGSIIGRGLDIGDMDGDGDLDAIILDSAFQAHILENELKTIEGTSGDDVIEIEFLADQVEVLINGQSDSFGIESYMAVDGLAGNDQIIVRGSSSQNAHASADADTGSFSVTSGSYQLAGSGFTDVTFDSFHTVELYGSSDPAKKDKLRGSFGGTFPGTVDETTLHAGYVGTDPNTADYIFRALNVNHVESFGRGGVGDYAQLFGSDYHDHFYRFTDHELLVAVDSTQRTQGFARVDAFGRHGTDVAYFEDTTGDDHFYTFPEFVVMVLGNDQDRVMAKGFLDVTGVSEKGGNDTANLRNAQTFDTLFASSNVALLLRQEQRESVLGFADLNAAALSGETPLQLIDDAAANVSLTGTWVEDRN